MQTLLRSNFSASLALKQAQISITSKGLLVRSYSSSSSKHPKDIVYETDREKQLIQKAVENILEEDLEHDELGMKQHKHEKPYTWKQAEQDAQHHEDDSERPSLPSGPDGSKK